MVIQGFFEAMGYFLQPTYLIIMVVATIIGVIIGIIPGVGGLVALSLFLPFAFNMSPDAALPFMIALSSVTYTGGAITAILIGVPGTGPNAATVADGFSLAKQGKAGRALGAALGASGFGGMVTVLPALAMVPLVLPMIRAIRTEDMVFVILLGLAFVGVLGRESMTKGLISGGIGLLTAFIGFQAVTGLRRFTFGSNYLYDGIPLVPICLGLFALPTLVKLAISGGTIAEVDPATTRLRDVWEGIKDVVRHWSLFLRSSVIGYIVGIIPGIGAETAVFVAYGQAKQTSKHPEMFGHGAIEGVIAPETANNAKEAGSLLTTLALGIPGSAAMAIVLGGFIITGLTPGPKMMTDHLGLSINLLITVAVSNFLGMIICIFASPYLARVPFIPSRILVPLVLALVFTGAFAYHGEFADVVTTLVFGIIGVLMVKFDYTRPALLLGYVLGDLFERYLYMSLGLSGPFFFMRPISLVLIAIFIAVLVYEPAKGWLGRRRKASALPP